MSDENPHADEPSAAAVEPLTDEGIANLAAGTRVEHFRLVRFIGKGGTAVVYLARDSKLGRRVALKMVRPSYAASPESRAAFVHEARATARFNHPNIVAIHWVGEWRGIPYVALEYLEGQTLRQRVGERALGAAEATRTGLAVARALEVAHGAGVVHADLKPENVLIPPDGRARVVDFGLARVVAGGAESADLSPPLAVSGADEALVDGAGEAAGDDDALVAGDFASGPQRGRGPSGPMALPRATVQRGRRVQAQRVEEPPRVQGTPAYMAPEQWRGQAVSGATDIWALGLMLGEMAAHWRPFPMRGKNVVRDAVLADTPVRLDDDALDGLPGDLVQLIGRCLSREPARRPTAREAAEVLDRLLPVAGAEQALAAGPFRGLLPFSDQHAALFFGREAEIAAAVERLRNEPVLPLVGPSGAGKTSLAHAGILPRLAEQERWTVLSLRPGRDPFGALAQQLLRSQARITDVSNSNATTVVVEDAGSAGDVEQQSSKRVSGAFPRALRNDPALAKATTVDEVAEQLGARPELLSLALREMAVRRGRRVLLVVDQLEEICTLVSDERVRRRFIAAVCGAADDRDDPLRVVLCMRDDYLGRIAETPQAREVLSRLMLVRTPGREALEQILRRPLELLDYRYDDESLVDEMIEAVRGEPAALPLLQVATSMLWERRDRRGRVVTRKAYEGIGGVAGALAQHADAVLASLSPAELPIAREILLRLVSAEGTRRVLTRERVAEGLAGDVEAVLTRLIAGRLVNARQLPGAEEPGGELELVHESLVVRWSRLARWIEASREELRFLAEARQAAELWKRRGERPSELWAGEALVEAEQKLSRCTTRPPEAVTAFLAAGRGIEQTRRARKRRALWALIAALVLVAGGASIVSYIVIDRSRQVDEQRQQARLRWAEAQREGAAAALLRGDLLEARAKLRAALELRDSAAARALWRRLSRHQQLWRAATPAIVYNVAFSADGRFVAAASQSRVVYIFERYTRAMRILRGHHDQVFVVSYAPDGKLASGSLDGEVRLWSRDGATSRVLGKHAGAVRAIAFARSGKLLLSVGSDGKLRVFPLEGAALSKPLTIDGARGPLLALAVALSGADERVAVAGAGKRVRMWQLRSLLAGGAPDASLQTEALVQSLSFGRARGRRRLAVGLSNGQVLLYVQRAAAAHANGASAAATSWRKLRTLRGHRGSVRALGFAPGSGRLASGGVGGRLLLWSEDGRAQRVGSYQAAVYGLAFDPRGELIAAGGADRQVRLLDPRRADASRPLPPHAGPVSGVAISPDGARLASGGSDHTVRLWHAASGRLLQVLRGHDDRVSEVAYSPDGKLLASASWDRTVRLWDARSGAALRTLSAHGGAVRALEFHPSGALLASGARDGVLRLWRSDTGSLLHELRGHAGPIAEVAFSPDGKLLASAGHDRTVRLWRIGAGAGAGAAPKVQSATTLSGHSDRVYGLAFSKDCKTLYTASFDGSVRAWSLTRSDEGSRTLLSGMARLYRLARGVRGDALYVAGADGTARRIVLGGAGRPNVRVVARHLSEVNDLSVDGQGRLASASDDGSVRLWRAADGRPLWRGVLLLDQPTLLLSHSGWRDLGRSAPTAPATAWARAARRARLGAVSRAHVCLVLDGATPGALTLALWSRSARAARGPLATSALDGPVDDLLATADGCAVLSRRRLRLLGARGEVRQLANDVSAIARVASDQLLVARDRTVQRLDARGRRVGLSVDVAASVSAVAATAGGELFVGFADGSIERRGVDGRKRQTASFEGAPGSAVTRLLAGPAQTIVAGFADGTVAMWRANGGARLERAQLHGPTRWLVRAGSSLYAASALGGSLRWDLSAFDMSHCVLLRRLWRHVRVVWENGQPRRRGPPRAHRCFASRSKRR